MQVSDKIESLFNDFNNQYKNLTKNVIDKNCLINDYMQIVTRKDSDNFFQKYGVGNVIDGHDRPYERQKAYELLLKILHYFDNDQYNKMHKGTPFFFISWCSFQYHDFTKSLFYMDASVSEDYKIYDVVNMQICTSSMKFFLLTDEKDVTIHQELKTLVSNTLVEYNKNKGSNITILDFRAKFISDLLYSENKKRSLLSAFYVFLLQYHDIKNQLIHRSKEGGSIQPFLNHLFDGARILESLLELKDAKGNNLRNKISNKLNGQIDISILRSSQRLSDATRIYKDLINQGKSFQECNYATSYIIRNTTAHSLLWLDEFTDESYTILYNCLINSLIWTIDYLWIQNNN